MENRIENFVLLLLCAALLGGCGSSAETAAYLESGADTGGQTVAEETEAVPSVTVYVCGAVKSPGVYVLKEGARICDALEAAGGLTKKASPDAQNLAELLTDGQMVSFPTKEEASAAQTGADAGDGRVNINTADAAALMTLSGIGEARAAAIIAYRTEHGAFAAAEDIKKVSGIGDALFSKIEDDITIR